MEQGTIKWFNAKKGFGFIAQDTGEDIFVHHSAIDMTGFRTLAQGEMVEFESRESEKGLSATKVLKVE